MMETQVTNKNAGFKRTHRISHLIKRELSDIVRKKVGDPRLQSLTITEVEVQPDLRHAVVKVCRMIQDPSKELDAKEKKEVLKALKSAQGFIFEHLRKRLEIKFIPHLEYRYDSSIAESSRLWGKIKNISGAKDAGSE